MIVYLMLAFTYSFKAQLNSMSVKYLDSICEMLATENNNGMLFIQKGNQISPPLYNSRLTQF